MVSPASCADAVPEKVRTLPRMPDALVWRVMRSPRRRHGDVPVLDARRRSARARGRCRRDRRPMGASPAPPPDDASAAAGTASAAVSRAETACACRRRLRITRSILYSCLRGELTGSRFSALRSLAGPIRPSGSAITRKWFPRRSLPEERPFGWWRGSIRNRAPPSYVRPVSALRRPTGEAAGRRRGRRARAPACRPISASSAAAWTAVSSTPGVGSAAGMAAVGLDRSEVSGPWWRSCAWRPWRGWLGGRGALRSRRRRLGLRGSGLRRPLRGGGRFGLGAGGPRSRGGARRLSRRRSAGRGRPLVRAAVRPGPRQGPDNSWVGLVAHRFTSSRTCGRTVSRAPRIGPIPMGVSN